MRQLNNIIVENNTVLEPILFNTNVSFTGTDPLVVCSESGKSILYL